MWQSYTLLHDLLIVDCIPDIDVGFKWDMGDRWIKVEDVRR